LLFRFQSGVIFFEIRQINTLLGTLNYYLNANSLILDPHPGGCQNKPKNSYQEAIAKIMQAMGIF
jgi:hypothetical protein